MAKKVTCVDLAGDRHEVDISKLTWRPSVYAVVIDNGKLLMAVERGKYTLPGGGIDFGEMPEDAVIREAKEETGMDVQNPELLACRSELFTHHGESRDFHHQTILLYYRCQLVSGELSTRYLPQADRPFHGEPEWIPLDKLNEVEILNRYDWRFLVKEIAG